jgi:hypothetical protein
MIENVVVFGTDPVLIRTRQILLESAGYSTKTVSRLAEAEGAMSRNCSLLVVCSSVSRHDAIDALIAADALEVDIKRLLVSSDVAIEPSGDVEVVSGLAGPEAFLKSISRLLREREEN